MTFTTPSLAGLIRMHLGTVHVQPVYGSIAFYYQNGDLPLTASLAMLREQFARDWKR